MRNKWFRRIAILVLIVAVVVVLRLTVFQPDPVPVTIYRVSTGTVEEIVTNSKAGTVKTRNRAELSTEIGGLVAELPVREGDLVEKGQILLRLADLIAERAETNGSDRLASTVGRPAPGNASAAVPDEAKPDDDELTPHAQEAMRVLGDLILLSR